MCSLRWPELFLLLFQSSSLWALVGDVSWPLPFPQPEMRTAGFLFGETQPFLKSSQPELHVRAALVMFLPVHHQNRPNKKPRFSLFPCDFMSPVHLTFCCHPLFLSAQCLLWFRNWWLQHISQRESRTSRRVSVSVSGNVELAGAAPSLLSLQ